MSSITLFRAVLPALFIATTLTRSQAVAQEGGMPTAIAAVTNAPVALTKCALARTYGASWRVNGNIVLGNRTPHRLATASVTFTVFDGENTKMDQQTRTFTFAQPVVSGDTVAQPVSVEFEIGNRGNLIQHVSCRIAAATFSGDKRWNYGERWTEKLVKLVSETNENAGGEGAVKSAVQGAARTSVAVVNSWNDVVGGTLFVHDTIVITGGDADASLRASDLALTMALAGGARKTYVGLVSAAPTYQKLNPLGSQTQTAFEVDPATDLGRLGTITVPAHGMVTTTVTFVVPDMVATATDNRSVSVR